MKVLPLLQADHHVCAINVCDINGLVVLHGINKFIGQKAEIVHNGYAYVCMHA